MYYGRVGVVSKSGELCECLAYFFSCGGIFELRGNVLMKEGLPERLKLVYGWHSVAGPGGPVRSDVGLDE